MQKCSRRSILHIHTYASLSVLVQLVAVVAGAEGAVGGMLTMMRAASVILLTTVNDLHLYTW